MATNQDAFEGWVSERPTLRAPGWMSSAAAVLQRPSTLLVAWIAVIVTLIALEPAPADPTPAIPAWEAMLALGFTAALGATIAGLGLRRSWGFRASAATAVLGGGIAFACAATAHHAGPWWGIEMASFAALGGLTAFAARKSSGQ